MNPIATRIELAEDELDYAEGIFHDYCEELLQFAKDTMKEGDWVHSSTRTEFEKLIGLIEDAFEKCDDAENTIERLRE